VFEVGCLFGHASLGRLDDAQRLARVSPAPFEKPRAGY
jgi:hypothetical protein